MKFIPGKSPINGPRFKMAFLAKSTRSPTYIDQFWSLITNINFILAKSCYWQEVPGPFDLDLSLKIQYLKICKIIVECSLIVHLIGNFILKRVNTGHFLIKLKCEEIWRHINIWRHRMGPWRHIYSTVGWIKKCPVLMFFGIKLPIDWALNEVSMIILKIFKN